jgi:hypothetical protein
MTSRLWSHPNARAAIKTLTWFPVIFFFLENGYSTATVQGRSMQVQNGSIFACTTSGHAHCIRLPVIT